MRPIAFVTLVSLLLVFSGAATAQDADPEATPELSAPAAAPGPLPDISVRNVTLAHDPSSATLTITADYVNNDGCDMPTEARAELQNGVLWVDVLRTEQPAEDQACTRALLPGSAEVTLDISEENFGLELPLIAEDYAAVVAMDRLNNSAGTLDLPVFGEITPMVLEPLLVLEMSVQEIARVDGGPSLPVGLALTLQAGGCDGDPLVRVQLVDANAAPDNSELSGTAEFMPMLRVRAVRALVPQQRCTRNLQFLETTARIPLDALRQLRGEVVISDGADLSITHDFGLDLPDRLPQSEDGSTLVPVSDVEVVITRSSGSDSGVVSVTVSGELPDGCSFPRDIAVRTDILTNTVTITITEQRDPDAMCTQVITPYTEDINLGSFGTGTYTLTVNGVEVTFTI